ncbi:MAG: 16S rRNA (guanine(527)-N(7))-methyltransferase RsmG [Oscillospiraceae bacterium]|nr:16S rRNA (guanine(527)-N(7))-methyltransferase RsmG [Oscillospiraceae bacterium]
MIDKQRFLQKAAAYGIDATHCVDALCRYATLLVEYNEKVNLTAITDAEGIENKHFIDSLLFAAQKEVAGKVVDVGTGAGFPGIVAKLYKPEIALTLMEPTGKRVEFLRYACETLGIQAELVKERAEEAARKKWRETFDIATARAVASLPMLCEYCLPLVKTGGLFIAMKGDAAEEQSAAAGAIEKLGGAYLRQEAFTLPDGAARCLIFTQKISHTPPVYPRNGGKIAKAPLK